MLQNTVSIIDVQEETLDPQAFASFGKVISNKDGIIQIVGLDDVVVG